jgi:hypothetical protein
MTPAARPSQTIRSNLPVTALVKRLGWTCVVVSGVPTVVSRMPTV